MHEFHLLYWMTYLFCQGYIWWNLLFVLTYDLSEMDLNGIVALMMMMMMMMVVVVVMMMMTLPVIFVVCILM